MLALSPFRLVLAFLTLAAISLLVLPRLNVDLLPKDRSPQLLVSFQLPGAPPDVVEQQATAPLEGVLSGMNGLKAVRSVSGYDQGRIALAFDRHVDMELRLFEVRALIRQVYPRLPEGLSYPRVEQGAGSAESKAQMPLLAYTVEGPAAAHVIRRVTTAAFRKALSGIPGLRAVELSGPLPPDLQVRYDGDRLRAYGLDGSALPRAIAERFGEYYPGMVRQPGGRSSFLKVTGGRASAESLRNLLLPAAGGRLIRLGEVAEVTLEAPEPSSYFRINGKSSVSLSLYAQAGENGLALAGRLKQRIAVLARCLPPGYVLRLESDKTAYLAAELRKSQRRAAGSMGILAAFILLAYRDWRRLLVLGAALAVNLALTLLLAWALDLGIHLYTLAGLAIAFGMMIDNAIVMLDDYGERRSRQVFTALLGATLTTVAALGLVWLLPEEDRQNLSDFAAVVALSLLASLAVALGFIPGLAELLGIGHVRARAKLSYAKQRRQARWFRAYARLMGFLARYRKVYLGLWLLAFGLPLFLLPAQWPGQDWYNRSIGSDLYQKRLRPVLEPVLGGSLRLFARNAYARAGYRAPERKRLMVVAELPHGNTPKEMDQMMRRMEKVVQGVHGIEKYVTQVLSGELGSMEITFRRDAEHGALPHQLRSRLIARSTQWSGVAWKIFGVGQGFSTGGMGDNANFSLRLQGYGFDELERQAAALKKQLESHPRVRNVNTDALLDPGEKPAFAFRLSLNDAALAQLGLSPEQVFAALRQESAPLHPALSLDAEGGRMPVWVAERQSRGFSIHEMMATRLLSGDGLAAHLRSLATLQLEKGAPAIHKEDRQYIRVLSYEFVGSDVVANSFLEQTIATFRPTLLPGYSLEPESGHFWGRQKARRQGRLLLVLALANFVICAVLFEHIRRAVAVVLVIPLSFIGLFLTFGWGGFYFDQGGFAAMVLLCGITVNAAIFIVNDFNNCPLSGKNGNRTLLKSTVNRARTILLTVLSTICGLLPFLAAGDGEVFWFSLSVGAAGGLLCSLVAVFGVLPVLLWRNTRHRMDSSTAAKTIGRAWEE